MQSGHLFFEGGWGEGREELRLATQDGWGSFSSYYCSQKNVILFTPRLNLKSYYISPNNLTL